MVAALLGLRFQVLANTLRRSLPQLIAVIFGSLFALLILGVVVLTCVLVGTDAESPVRGEVEVYAGTVVTIGWMALPLLASGVEPTLEPRKLAPFPLPLGRMMTALLLVGVLWVPGITTLASGLMTGVLWRETPAAAIAAVCCAVIATLTCVVGSRAATQLAANLVARSFRGARILLLGVAILVLVGPVVLAINVALSTQLPDPSQQPPVSRMLGLTPWGAAWSIPGAIADGRLVDASVSLAIAVATLAVLAALWAFALRHALRTRGGSGPRLRAHQLGVLGVAPTGPTAAIAARQLILSFRDSRLARQLVILPVLPALVLLFAFVVHVPAAAYAAAPMVAGLVPLAQFAGLSFDGTAFAGQLAAGVRGVSDRAGRAFAMLAIALPVVVVVAVVAMALLGDWAQLPTVLGLAIGALCAGVAVSSVSSALIVVSLPSGRRNPFTSAPGSNTTQIVGSYVVTLIAGALMVPELALGVPALLTRDPGLGWAAFGVGVGWGAVVVAIGIVAGGNLLDRTAPSLLARLRRAVVR